MSLQSFMMALSLRALSGNERLAMLAAGDCDGILSLRSAAAWCCLPEAQAMEVLDALCAQGWMVRLRSGRYLCPWLVPPPEAEITSLRQPYVSQSVRRAVYLRDGFRCHYCGSDQRLTLDHKLPVSRGGGHTADNLVTCCKRCNSAKGTRDYSEFRSEMEARHA